MSKTAQAYIGAVVVTGSALLAFALAQWRSDDPLRFLVFLVLFAVAAALKCRVPGVTGTYSPVFFFVLLGCATLSFSEMAVASAVAGVVQCTFRQLRRPSLLQICFNAASIVICDLAAFAVVQNPVPALASPVVSLTLAAVVLYVVNTSLVSIVLTLVERGRISEIWKHWCLGSLPYYVAGAIIAGATITAAAPVTSVVVMLIAPSILLVTIYYHLWLRSSAAAHSRSS